MKLTSTLFGVTALFCFVMSGCSEVDYGDVQSARDKVEEERRETDETRREVAENVQEEEQETAEARHDAMKPALPDGVREEAAETEEARREGAEAIAEEEKETREAEKELQETEAQFAAKQSRDAYVKQVEATLEQTDRQIAALRERASKEGELAERETKKQITELTMHQDRVKDELGELKGAELLEWETHREPVQRALDGLKGELDESK
ncbi:MAG: hypothetical protein ABI614_07165 [Planctomycetota bacterium]